jgi:Na+/H+ antiporter NhaD/arsenite permease-like protein
MISEHETGKVKPSKLFGFLRKNIVFLISFVAATVSAVIVPPDKAYADYFDFKTLTCLFCVLAVVCALRNISFFAVLSRKIVALFRNTRLAVLGLVYITLIGSMLIANDMALIAFLPLAYFVLTETKQQKHMAFTFIMQNFAANLGGMITPLGNPQNLYLYSKYAIPTGEFIGIMLPYFILSVVLITACCLFIKSEPLTVPEESTKLPTARTAAYLGLFVLAIAVVFEWIPYYVGLIIIPAVLVFMDRKALCEVDYPLLLTFVCFFIFSGNMARIEAVRSFFGTLLEKSTLISTILSCQVISNVPTAILFSQFTENYRELLIGVNIGGAGTIVASLASLITYQEYAKSKAGKAGRYMLLFTLFNIIFLAVLVGFALLIK